MKTQTISFKIISLPKFPKISLKKIITLQIILLLTSLCFFLLNACAVLKESTLKQKYQADIEKLKKEIEVLEITFAKTSSLSQLENYFSREGFVKISPNKIRYLESSNEALVTGK